MQTESANKIIPSRPNFIDNKVVVVDGLIGGGKGLISQIISALPGVEMWVHNPQIEQVCGLHHLDHVSMEGAITLIKNWVDEEAYNLSMLRNANFRHKDMSSIFKYPRKFSYLFRLFEDVESKAMENFDKNDRILNFMTHSNTAYALPLFEALGKRLIYIRFVRSPMTEYMHNHLARWSNRWGKDIRSGMLLYKKDNLDDKNIYLPFFLSNNDHNYDDASPIEKAIYILQEWQNSGDNRIDVIKQNQKYEATIFEIPFEKFVFEPMPFIENIAKALNVQIDKVTKMEMKKQKVPRKSLTDSPRIRYYENQGWRKPLNHDSVKNEFDMTRERIKQKISLETIKVLDEIQEQYINRYNIL